MSALLRHLVMAIARKSFMVTKKAPISLHHTKTTNGWVQIFQPQMASSQVAIFDATNNTRERRKMVWERVEDKGIRWTFNDWQFFLYFVLKGRWVPKCVQKKRKGTIVNSRKGTKGTHGREQNWEVQPMRGKPPKLVHTKPVCNEKFGPKNFWPTHPVFSFNWTIVDPYFLQGFAPPIPSNLLIAPQCYIHLRWHFWGRISFEKFVQCKSVYIWQLWCLWKEWILRSQSFTFSCLIPVIPVIQPQVPFPWECLHQPRAHPVEHWGL